MSLKEDIKPITYLKNKTAKLVAKVSGSGRAVIITQNGEAKAVVMDIRQYERWRNALAMMKIIAHSESEVASGEALSQEEAFSMGEAAFRDGGDE